MRVVRIAVVTFVALAAFAPFQVQAARQADKDAKDVADAVAAFKASDKALPKWFDTSYGYVVFPNIAKGAVGRRRRQWRRPGSSRRPAYVGDGGGVTQVTVGAQLGGQSFSEVIFFENPRNARSVQGEPLRDDRRPERRRGRPRARLRTRNIRRASPYSRSSQGLMAEASVGGQKFKFTPKK